MKNPTADARRWWNQALDDLAFVGFVQEEGPFFGEGGRALSALISLGGRAGRGVQHEDRRMNQPKQRRSQEPDDQQQPVNRPHCLPIDQRAAIIEHLISELAAEHDILFAFLYGSFLEPGVFHDVDVGIYLRSVERGAILALDLAERLSTRIGIPTDVRILNAAPIPFLYHVLRGRLLLNRDEDLLGEIMERTVSRYLDITPLLRHSTKEAFARWT